MTTTTTVIEAQKLITVSDLNAHDRCDSGCGAAARAVITVRNKTGDSVGQLALCLHHASKHEAKLVESGSSVERNDTF